MYNSSANGSQGTCISAWCFHCSITLPTISELGFKVHHVLLEQGVGNEDLLLCNFRHLLAEDDLTVE